MGRPRACLKGVLGPVFLTLVVLCFGFCFSDKDRILKGAVLAAVTAPSPPQGPLAASTSSPLKSHSNSRGSGVSELLGETYGQDTDTDDPLPIVPLQGRGTASNTGSRVAGTSSYSRSPFRGRNIIDDDEYQTDNSILFREASRRQSRRGVIPGKDFFPSFVTRASRTAAVVAALCITTLVAAVRLWKCSLDYQAQAQRRISSRQPAPGTSTGRRLAERGVPSGRGGVPRDETAPRRSSGLYTLENEVPGTVIFRSRFGLQRRAIESLCTELSLEEFAEFYAPSPPTIEETSPERVFEVETRLEELAAKFTGHLADAEESMSQWATSEGRGMRENTLHRFWREIQSEFEALQYTIETTPDAQVRFPREIRVMRGSGPAYEHAIEAFNRLQSAVRCVIGGDLSDPPRREIDRAIADFRDAMIMVYLPDTDSEDDE